MAGRIWSQTCAVMKRKSGNKRAIEKETARNEGQRSNRRKQGGGAVAGSRTAVSLLFDGCCGFELCECYRCLRLPIISINK